MEFDCCSWSIPHSMHSSLELIDTGIDGFWIEINDTYRYIELVSKGDEK